MDWKIVNPLEVPTWNELLSNHTTSSFFHTTNWARVLHESYYYIPKYFISSNGTMENFLPFMEIQSYLTGRRGVSLPFTDYSSPVFTKEMRWQDWMDPVIRYGRESGWKYIEIRNSLPLTPSEPAFTTYIGHALDIFDGVESVKSKLRDSTNRNIGKAIREGVSVAGFTTEESVREYYRMHRLTRRGHGLPPQPFRFFKKIYEHVISKGFGFVTLASYKGRNIAGAVFFHYRGKAIFKFGASEKAYQRLRPNNLVMWEAIRLCIEKGCRSFCFGRTDLGNTGLMQFKSGWGAQEKKIHYYRYDLETDRFIPGSNYIAPIFNNITKHIPLAISQFVGELLYRHMG